MRVLLSSTWSACWASASATTCARRCSTTCKTLSLSYYSRTPVGWIMSRVTSDLGTRVRPGHLGHARFHLGRHEHPHLDDLHADHQLAAGADRACHSAHPAMRRHPVPQAHPGPVSQGAQDELQDHRRLQRKHHRCARGQSPGPRRRKICASSAS